VVRAGYVGEFAELGHATEDGPGEPGMLLHDGPLRIVEFGWLVKDGVGHAEFAKIVQQGGAVE
jgi:hypothetical protein